MQVPATERRCARFGPFTVDLVSRELHNNGRKISLQDKPFQILAILLEQPGELVTREQFRQRLWPADTFVDFEHSINTAIKKLREALEDGGEEHQYIETLPKRGYRFIGTVEDSANGREGPAAPGESVAPAAKEQRQVRGRGRWYRYVLAVALVAALLVTALNLGGRANCCGKGGERRGATPGRFGLWRCCHCKICRKMPTRNTLLMG